MNYGQGGNTPYLPNNQSKTMRIVKVGGIFLAVLIAIIVTFNLFFNDDSKKQAFDRTIQQQLVVSSVAELAQQYSDSPAIDNLAATSKSVGVSNASTLSDMKASLFGEPYVNGQIDLSEYQQDLATAQSNGTADTLARDLLTRACQSALTELETLRSETSSESNRQTIQKLQENVALLLADIDPDASSVID